MTYAWAKEFVVFEEPVLVNDKGSGHKKKSFKPENVIPLQLHIGNQLF